MNELRLEFLDRGEYFEVVGCEKSYRNLRVRRVTDCSVTVDGDRLEGESWQPFHAGSFSCGTSVRRVDTPVGAPAIQIVENAVVQVKRGRGRPKGSKNKK